MASLARITGATGGLNPAFLTKVNSAADSLGIPTIEITSGLRSPSHNAAVGGVPHSNHLTGDAIDAYAVYANGRRVPLGVALQPVVGQFGLRSGNVPGFYNGNPDPVHVDDAANQDPRGTGTLLAAHSTLVGLPAPLAGAITGAARTHGVDPAVLAGIWRIESGSSYPNAFVNSSGYGGLFGTTKWNAPAQVQANYAAQILARLIREKGSLPAALLAYSGGGYSSVPGGGAGTVSYTGPGSSPAPAAIVGSVSAPASAAPRGTGVVAAAPHAPLYPGAPPAVTRSAFPPAKPAGTATATTTPTAAPFDWTAWAAKVAGAGAVTPADLAALGKTASTRAASETAATIAGIRALQDAANRQAAVRAAQQEQLGVASSRYLEGLDLGGRSATDYANAAAAQRAAAAGYSGGLQQTVSDAAAGVQANLDALGSPQTAANQGQAAGNALYGLGGNLPSEALDAIGPTVAAGLRALPAQTLGYGQTLAAGELGAGQQEAAKLTPDIVAARAGQAALAAKYLDTLSTQARQAGQDRVANLFKIAAIAQTQDAAAAKASRIDAAASRVAGHIVYYDGTEPTDAKGNFVPVAATGAAAKSTYRNDAFGRLVEIAPDGTQTVRSSGRINSKDGSILQVGVDGKITTLVSAPGKTVPDHWVTGKDGYSYNTTTGEKFYTGGSTPQAPSDTAQTAPPRFDAGRSRALGKRVDQYGHDILVNGKPALMSGWHWGKSGQPVKNATAGGSSGAPKPKDINDLVDGWKNGSPTSVTVVAKDADGSPIRNSDGVLQTVTRTGVQGKLNYQQAYRKLRALKISDPEARKYLDTAYKRGEQGRAWLTNEEQAALQRAQRATSGSIPGGSQALKTTPTIINGHPLLNPQQVRVLRQAGLLPPGQITQEGFYVIAQAF